MKPTKRTNAPNTCKWCGRKLYFNKRYAKLLSGGSVFDKPKLIGQALKSGRYEDGHFCTLRCAWRFAVHLANQGHVLKEAE